MSGSNYFNNFVTVDGVAWVQPREELSARYLECPSSSHIGVSEPKHNINKNKNGEWRYKSKKK